MNEKKAELRKQILKARNTILPEQRQLWDQQILQHLIKYDKKSPCPVYLCYVNYKSEVSTKEFILWCLENEKKVFVPKVLTNNDFETGKKSGVSEKAEEKPSRMEFYQITAWEELKEGYQGILEPAAVPKRAFIEQFKTLMPSEQIKTSGAADQKKCMEWKEDKIQPCFRMLLPGAVFDKSGNRVGYGGGFYDRWLAEWNGLQCDSMEKAANRPDSSDSTAGMLEKIGLAYQMQIVDEIPAEIFDQKIDFVMTEEGVTGRPGGGQR